MKKLSLVVLSLTFAGSVFAHEFIHTIENAEAELNAAWDALDTYTQDEMRPNERVWIKYKESLKGAEKIAAIEERAEVLWNKANHDRDEAQAAADRFATDHPVANTTPAPDPIQPVEETSPDFTNSADKARTYMIDFYERLHQSNEVSVVKCSVFEPFRIRGHQYFIAKECITNHPSGNQQVLGVVVDLPNNWIKAMPVDSFRDFVRTGNRYYLGEPNLDVAN